MTSKRKLEEEVARTTDPLLRKQLQELITKREKRSEEKIKKVGRFVDDLGEIGQELAPTITGIAIGAWIIFFIALIALFLVLMGFFD